MARKKGWGVAQVYTRAPGFGPDAWVHELAPETVRPDETESDVKRRMAKKYGVKESDIRLKFPLEENPRRKRKVSKRAARLMGRRTRSPQRSARRNPHSISETRNLRAAMTELEWCMDHTRGEVNRKVNSVHTVLSMLYDQAAKGIHVNPTLAILGNPGKAKVVGTLSHRLYELRYKHAKDGKDYRHPFGPGAAVVLLSDGNVLIRAKHRLWEDI